ncbi:MAG: ATP-binding protein, partial [Ginsengibacter sp.]
GLANVIASNSVSAIEFLDNDAATAILSDLKKISPEIMHGAILDNKGKVFAAYSNNGKNNFEFPLPLHPNKKLEFSDDYLLVYSTIADKNEKLGTVCLQVKLSELSDIKNEKYRIAAILLIVGIGLAFLIALIIQPYISKRLLYLVSVMNQAGKTGDYTNHVQVEGKDEITAFSFVFNNLMDQIQESHKKKDEFIGIASHELKTPLTSIKAYLQVLAEMENQQPNKQYVQKALENVNKLQQLLFDLLDVSKIQSGQLELNINEFNIDALIDEAIAASQIISAHHKIIREGKPIAQNISADRQRIEQVLINLLSNATKYSPGANKVIVRTSKTASEVIVSVKDLGIGIPAEEQSKIFDRFYRSSELSRHHISGFGLGLYICKDIITRHGGKIWIESIGNGSVFNFSLPLNHTSSTISLS